jgi:hypothetical protein
MKGQNYTKWLFLLNLIFVIIQSVHLRPLINSEEESDSTEVTDLIDSNVGSGYVLHSFAKYCGTCRRKNSKGMCIKIC